MDFGEDRGGVTGALLEIRSGGRDVLLTAVKLERNGKRYDDGLESKRVGLWNEDELGLAL